jgi:predicted nucleic acid-binding protein
MIHLDTSFLIRSLQPGSPQDRKLRSWIAEGQTLRISAIAWAEFLCGPISLSDMSLVARVVGQKRDFRAEQAAIAARLFNEAGRRRGSLIDCMIAATAIADNAAIATANESDFRRFEGVGLTLV